MNPGGLLFSLPFSKILPKVLLRARRARTTTEGFHLALCTYLTHGAAPERAPGVSSHLQPHSNGDSCILCEKMQLQDLVDLRSSDVVRRLPSAGTS